MVDYQYDRKDIEDQQKVILRGRVAFSRLSRVCNKDEREHDKNPFGKPLSVPEKDYCTINLSNVEILPQSGNLNNLTFNENFVLERCFESKKPEKGRCYNRHVVPGKYLIPVYIINDPTKNTIEQRNIAETHEEISPGTLVQVELKGVNKQANSSTVAVESVLVLEAPENGTPFFNPGGAVKAPQGYTIVGKVTLAEYTPAPEPEGQPLNTGWANPNAQVNVAPQNGVYGGPQQQPQQVAQPQYQQQYQQMPQQVAPQQQAVPQQQATPASTMPSYMQQQAVPNLGQQGQSVPQQLPQQVTQQQVPQNWQTANPQGAHPDVNVQSMF